MIMGFIEKYVPKSLLNILGMRAIYQLSYMVFTVIVIKKLAVNEYGSYSYIVAMTVYFSSVPLLGLPLYLQRNMARGSVISYEYFIIVLALTCIALILAYIMLPSMGLVQKIGVMLIILAACINTILVSINDGLGRYLFQYKFFLLTNLWSFICIFQVIFLRKNITFNLILNYWLTNSLIVLIVAFVIFFRLPKQGVKVVSQITTTYPLILADLILLYAVGIPDNFARFFDKFLAKKFLSDTFLGYYSFNLMAVTAVYALFLRPINSVLLTQMVKVYGSPQKFATLMKKYYLYGLLLYFSIFCVYFPFSDQILNLVGLSKYIGTIDIFTVCFINALLYMFAIPYTTFISLSESGKKKLCYSFLSVLIFNIPTLMLFIRPTQASFLAGFILAYFSNLLLCIGFEYKLASYCLRSMLDDMVRVSKHQYLKLQSLI